jgi:MoxR-like ATPase
MEYSKMFNIEKKGVDVSYERSGPTRLADRTIEPVYEFTSQIELAVNIALATGRPLLVRGSPGSGKSSLAKAIAHQMKWRYYEVTVTSRTNAEDLLWTFDNLRRLNDAQAHDLNDDSYYIKPGILWWAFNRILANNFEKTEPFSPQPNSPESVILIDEIDKAEPDVPNNLLIPMGSLKFTVSEIHEEVAANKEHPPLIIITTNEERKLPDAFIRRCIILKLDPPDPERLRRIAVKHFGDSDDNLYESLAQEVIRIAKEERKEPNAAEFLDAVWACVSLGVHPPIGDEKPSMEWISIKNATFRKA